MIKFVEEGHTYFNSKGEIIPSVSNLVMLQFPDAYKGIPTTVLKNKASYGTDVHELIEKYERGEIDAKEYGYERHDPNLKVALNQYLKIKENFEIEIDSQEQIVDYEERYAGRYDILTKSNFLIDIKTTQKVHTELLECQLGLYYTALGINKEIGYCLWLPKAGKGELIAVNAWDKKRCLELLERYETENKSSTDYDFY